MKVSTAVKTLIALMTPIDEVKLYVVCKVVLVSYQLRFLLYNSFTNRGPYTIPPRKFHSSWSIKLLLRVYHTRVSLIPPTG